jgi:hypothetical protein
MAGTSPAMTVFFLIDNKTPPGWPAFAGHDNGGVERVA